MTNEEINEQVKLRIDKLKDYVDQVFNSKEFFNGIQWTEISKDITKDAISRLERTKKQLDSDEIRHHFSNGYHAGSKEVAENVWSKLKEENTKLSPGLFDYLNRIMNDKK